MIRISFLKQDFCMEFFRITGFFGPREDILVPARNS
jgi:hypothetical protein